MVIEQILLITGASIFGVLGTVHLAYTFFTNKFSAYDKTTNEAMMGTSPLITKETTMRNAWVGFDASHSFGAMLVAAFYIPLATKNMEIIAGSIWFSTLPVIIGVSYLICNYSASVPRIRQATGDTCVQCFA